MVLRGPFLLAVIGSVASRIAQWVQRRQQDLLPVEYFHVVFTIPSELHRLFRSHPAETYGLLLSSAAASLVELAADEKLLGARLGVLSVLHTWTQTLTYHPHVHCLVPGGGPSPDGRSWWAARPGFLLPTRPLAKLFAGKLRRGKRWRGNEYSMQSRRLMPTRPLSIRRCRVQLFFQSLGQKYLQKRLIRHVTLVG